MSTTRLTSREFNQDIARAKRAAETGPVIITDRGRPAFVLQRYDDWRRQGGEPPAMSLLDALADPASADIEFEPPRLIGPLSRPVDFD
ncbi:MAG: type II toxin-antitoxin system Phd/YefM family antitoxin [Alphaproteobacteria bacterium]|nr:type II toxin-antitoxin system Phd/YefM family antitoxin [Alphaproteobacteria bacterium]